MSQSCLFYTGRTGQASGRSSTSWKSVERPSISKQIAEARDKGDLSENAEYHAAKEAQEAS